MALQQKLISENPFKNKQIGRFRGRIVYLTDDEIKGMLELYNWVGLPETTKNSLQRFIFSIFTGLRISDIQSITPYNLRDGDINYTPQKTKKFGKAIKFKLPEVLYNYIEPSNEHVFNGQLTDQTINKQLKNVADYLSIKKNLTFHVARHTFATMMLRKEVPVTNVQKMMGHSKIEDTMIYAHIVSADLDKSIEKFDKIKWI